MGRLVITDHETDGADVDNQQGVGSTATPRLELDGEVDVGEMLVINDDEVDLDEEGFRHLDEDAGSETAEAQACAA
jgi:hypothetical protein